MANDRLYLRCRGCGDSTYLARYYPSTGAYLDSDECDRLPSTITHFLEGHLNCCRAHRYRAMSLGTLPLFDVVPEGFVYPPTRGWENLLDADGKPIECTPENLKKLSVSHPDLYAELCGVAAEESNKLRVVKKRRTTER